MFKRLCVTAGLCVALSLQALAQEARMTLVSEGKPSAAILVPKDAPQRAADAARVLSIHIGWMSGAALPVLIEDPAAPFVAEKGNVVPPKATPAGVRCFVVMGDSKLARSLGVGNEELGPSGIRIKTAGNALVFTGSNGDPYTTTYGVFEYLEMLGFRYLWPGETGKVVPKCLTVAVPALDHRYTPPIAQRNIRFTGARDRDKGLAWLGISKEEADAVRDAPLGREAVLPQREQRWLLWQRNGGDVGIRGGHAGAGLAGGWEKWGKEHPEWFALQKDGTRDQSATKDRWRLCVSNPGLIEQVAKDVIAKRAADPKIKCVSLSPNDNGYSSFCLCENCRKLDPAGAPKIKLQIFEKAGEPKNETVEYVSLTDRYVYFWNSVAERVAKVYPDLLMNVDAYSAYQDAPVERALHPNLIVRFVPDSIETWKAWQPKASRMFWRPNTLWFGKRDSLLHVYARKFTDAFHAFTDSGMLATDFDGCLEHWATQGMNYYVCARLDWNPKLTYEEILDDYCRSGFGPAAEHVKKYFRLAEQTYFREKYTITDPPRAVNLPPELVAQLRGELAQAQKAAGEDEAIRKRIAFLRMGLNWNELFITITGLSWQADAKQPYDKKRAQDLMMLAYCMLCDLTRHGANSINVPSMLGYGGNFFFWGGIGWRTFLQSMVDQDKALAVQNKGQPAPRADQRLTGMENSLDEMMAAYGIGGRTPALKPTGAVKPAKMTMEADERGRVREAPVP